MKRSWQQIGGELLVVLVLVAWSRQVGWTVACALVLLPGLRSLWWPSARRRGASSA